MPRGGDRPAPSRAGVRATSRPGPAWGPRWAAIAVVSLLAAAGVLVGGCGGEEAERVAVPERGDAVKSSAAVRAERRFYDGAPPVIPHDPLGSPCLSCHGEEGVAVPGLGFSPPAPHAGTWNLPAGASRGAAAGAFANCQQCHVFQHAEAPWVETGFVALAVEPEPAGSGPRFHELAPPVIPHRVVLRENCLACHAGPAAREEIRTSHPERARCRQCHLEQVTAGVYPPPEGAP